MAKKNQTAAKLAGGENQENQDAANQPETKKERKPREVKVKHTKGSLHEILHTLVDTLSSTQADYLHRHIIKKALKDEHAAPDSFEGELYTGLRSKVIA